MAGDATKPIGKIKTGDKVESADPNTGKHVGTRPVTHVWINHDHDLLDLTVSTGDHAKATIHTTANHPFWDATRHKWLPAGKLPIGDSLATPNGRPAHVLRLHVTPSTANRWNLTIEQLHTYYVLAGTTPVLVHNTSGCGPQISTHHERAGDLGKYTEGQSTRDPASQWYHEYLSNDDLLDGVNNADEGDGILVSRDGRILGGHHRWDEIQTRVGGGRIDPDTPIRIDVYGGK